MLGTVKWFDPKKGYGFLVPHEAGPDVFLHVSELRAGGIQEDPKTGDKFVYEVGTKGSKRFATRLSRPATSAQLGPTKQQAPAG